MAGKLSVEDAGLARLMQEMNSTSTSLRNGVTQLSSMLERLEGNWKGIAANAFNVQQKQLNQDYERVRRLLDTIEEAVGATKRGHQSNEQEVRSAMRGIDSGGAGGAGSGPGSRIAGL